MLFSSFEFIFLYLPITLAVFFLLNRHSRHQAILWMAGASLFFYAWWQAPYLLLLGASILFNYGVGEAILNARASTDETRAGRLLRLGLTVDVALLLYFKYTNFFIGILNAALPHPLPNPPIELPLGISFFTFTQIAYLADCRLKSVTRYGLANYVLFVSYFPHLIAGPILHHGEMMPQFNYRKPHTFNLIDISCGLTLFSMGLFKKVIIADNISFMANALYHVTSEHHTPGFYQAWQGSLAYTLQLYFDFSGYCDMAIGLSRLIGIKLPINFHSPYKARGPIDFWQRWHRTLSRFIRDYIYIPLGGSRKGRLRKYGNLFVSMFLAGVWHGAGWTFILWGLLHAAYLIANHLWRDARNALGLRPASAFFPFGLLSWLATFLAVNAAWVMFRAESAASGWTVLRAMADFRQAAATEVLKAADYQHFAVLAGLLAWVFLLPNTQQVMRRYSPAIGLYRGDRHIAFKWLRWSPNLLWAGLTAVLLTVSMLGVFTSFSTLEFLYFQF